MGGVLPRQEYTIGKDFQNENARKKIKAIGELNQFRKH